MHLMVLLQKEGRGMQKRGREEREGGWGAKARRDATPPKTNS